MATKNIILPETTTETIYNILKKNALEENEEQTLKKIEEGKALSGEICSKYIKKLLSQEINYNQFADFLAQELNIDKEKAAQISKEIENKILKIYDQKNEQDDSGIEKKLTNKRKSSTQKNQADTYRESID